MESNNKEKNPAEIFKLFDKWAESLPKDGEELRSGASFSRIGSEIKQHCSTLEDQGSDNNTTADITTVDKGDAIVKDEVVNTQKEELKPNFLFELKHDNTNESTADNTSPFECVYDFCLALEKFCKSKSTPENQLDIDEDWKKLLFTCSSHNPDRIMWIHLTFQSSHKLKLSWKQVVRRLMANFDDPKRNPSLESALSKFRFLPELESIYVANLEFARYANELGDDTKRIVELYLNGMPPTIKEVLKSTIAFDESTHFRFSLLDVQQRAAVFLTANEDDLIFYSKSAHLAIALEYEKVDTKNCEFHLLADHSTIECPDYKVLKFPYMDFTTLTFTSTSTTAATSAQPVETIATTGLQNIITDTGTRAEQPPLQVKAEIITAKEVQLPNKEANEPILEEMDSSQNTEQTKNPLVLQNPVVTAPSNTNTQQSSNPVIQQVPNLFANAGQIKDPVIQERRLAPDVPSNINTTPPQLKLQTSNVLSSNNLANNQKQPQIETTHQTKYDLTSNSQKPNHEVASTPANILQPNSAAQNPRPKALTSLAPAINPNVLQQKPADTAKASITALNTAPISKYADEALQILDKVAPAQPASRTEEKVTNQAKINAITQPAISYNSLMTKEKLSSEIPTGPAADREKDANLKKALANLQHLPVQQKNASNIAVPMQQKPTNALNANKPQAIKIHVPSNINQMSAANNRPLVSSNVNKLKGRSSSPIRNPSLPLHQSRPRSKSPRRSYNGTISRSRSRSPSADRHYHRSQSPPRRRHHLAPGSPSRRSESPETGCYIHGIGANHTTKDCRQAQLVIQPRKLKLDQRDPPPPNTLRGSKRGLKSNGEPNICIFCGLIFKPGHLGYCTKVVPRKKTRRN